MSAEEDREISVEVDVRRRLLRLERQIAVLESDVEELQHRVDELNDDRPQIGDPPAEEGSG